MGSVTFGVRVGHQVSHISSGVVPNMSVPVILGNTSYDHKTKSIRAEDQEVPLRSGEVVPVLRGLIGAPAISQGVIPFVRVPEGTTTTSRLPMGLPSRRPPSTMLRCEGTSRATGVSVVRKPCTPFTGYRWSRGLPFLIPASLRRCSFSTRPKCQ